MAVSAENLNSPRRKGATWPAERARFVRCLTSRMDDDKVSNSTVTNTSVTNQLVTMKKPDGLLDRDREWESLTACLQSSSPELYLLFGRRRAGKSFLLTRFAAESGGIYYQATKQTEKEQLATLSRIVGERFGDPLLRRVGFPAWEDLFDYLIAKAGTDPLVLVLDEFPYLEDAAPALPSILQRVWDHQLAGTRLKLVLSGSHISAMKRLTEADQPLYGRRTGRLDVRPFGYADAALFFPQFSAQDRLRAYAVFGGLPGHLNLVDPALSLDENAARHLLSSSARLYDEGAHVFDAFVQDAEVHYSIVEAIASGETRWGKIANRIGKQTSSLKRPLDWLLEMEVVKREAPVTEYPNPSHKTQRYSVTDPYLRFWHRFVAEIRARGLADLSEPDELWRAMVEPRLDDHMGSVFEEACRTFVGTSRHPRLPFRPVQVGGWWTEDHQEEIDVVALGGEGQVLLGECKWGTVSSADLDVLARRGELLRGQMKGARQVTHALFSGRGVQGPALQRRIAAGEALHFTVDDLYPPFSA
jgi:AAA+ ATPase superfamily predicted ATPase